MKKRLAICLVLASLVSCQGKKGDKGDTGNSSVKSYSGFVTSADQLIFVDASPDDYAIAVSIGDGTNYTNLPFYSTGGGVNIYYAFRFNVVELINANTTASTRYKIFLIQKSSSSGYQALMN